jgi:NADH dehydrogenase
MDTTKSNTKGKKVVIVGGGFAGLAAAKELSGHGLEITLIDRENHHLFQPLLYQVASAGLSAPSVAAPLRQILRSYKDITVLMAEVRSIDDIGQIVHLSNGAAMDYDTLLVAAGATHSYFGNDSWAAHAPGLKTLNDAALIRQQILNAFEAAELAPTDAERDLNLTFVIVGSGPTGVELAGSLAEIANDTLLGEFRNIDPSSAKIILVDGAERPLMAFPEKLSLAAGRALGRLGVELRTGAKVTAIHHQEVLYEKDGTTHTLRAGVILWAAGVKASPLGAKLTHNSTTKADRAGRLLVDSTLAVAGARGVFAAGDVVAVSGRSGPVPGVAPAAKQMGVVAAKNMLAYLSGKSLVSFEYQDFGALATIGRHHAVANLGKIQFSGYPAWLFWLFAHIFFLIGWRNRIVVLTDWAWAYWTKGRWARVVSQKRTVAESELPVL